MAEINIKLTPQTALNSWVFLNIGLREFDEAAIQEMLEHERTHRARPDFLRRIHQRLNKMRTMREREELLHDTNNETPST